VPNWLRKATEMQFGQAIGDRSRNRRHCDRCEATVLENADRWTVLQTVSHEKWQEVQTPQVAKVEVLLCGFEKVQREGMEVTDDVSMIEALGETVQLTKRKYPNLKITTLKDVEAASAILIDQGEGRLF
jgi:2-C-methyl-D-erythritol 4-phosphate cytidylyltransferase